MIHHRLHSNPSRSFLEYHCEAYQNDLYWELHHFCNGHLASPLHFKIAYILTPLLSS